jgi:hypothetical protein
VTATRVVHVAVVAWLGMPVGSSGSLPAATVRADALRALRSIMTPSPADQPPQSGAPVTDANLRSRLAQAEAVVSGTVSSTEQVPPRPPLSFHSPEWWQATINVDTVEKGQLPAKTVNVLYSNSTDVKWFQAPKLKPGEHCVLLLQRKDESGQPLPDLAVVDPLDVRPIGELDRVRSLLKTP